jgi:hypothetical protein
MLRSTGAYSLQTVVFDSPLVSIRGKRTKERGTSNTFIGITLYDKNGNEIFVKDINIDIFKPIIYFKKLNEFGNKFYNFGPKIAINVTINPGNLEAKLDGEIAILDLDDRGIKVHLHSNFMLRSTGAYSLQTVVFDSPLVSIRGKRIKERGTSNTFIGITLYDKNGNEIFVKDISIDIFKPIIYFKKKLFESMSTCLYYNKKSKSMEDTGIRNEIQNLDGEEYIKCIPNHLSIFTIGSYEKAKIIDSSQNIFDKILKIFKIVIICIIVFLLIICCCCICCLSNKS